jgi:hypothetical protein
MGAGQSTNGQASPELMKLQSDFAEANNKIDSIYKNNNNLATQIDLNSAVLPLAKTSDMANLVQKSDLTALTSSLNMDNLVQKSDLVGMAQKSDLTGMAQKSDLTGMAQKSDLTGMAQKSDLTGMAQKSDLTGLGKCNPNSNSESPNAFEIANAIKQTMLGINKDNSISCPINYTHLKSGYLLGDKNKIDINDFKEKMGDIICAIEPTSVYNVYNSKTENPYYEQDLVNLKYPLYRYKSEVRGSQYKDMPSNYTCPQNTVLDLIMLFPGHYQYKPMCILDMETYADRICTYGSNFNKNNNRFYCNPPPS